MAPTFSKINQNATVVNYNSYARACRDSPHPPYYYFSPLRRPVYSGFDLRLFSNYVEVEVFYTNGIRGYGNLCLPISVVNALARVVDRADFQFPGITLHYLFERKHYMFQQVSLELYERHQIRFQPIIPVSLHGQPMGERLACLLELAICDCLANIPKAMQMGGLLAHGGLIWEGLFSSFPTRKFDDYYRYIGPIVEYALMPEWYDVSIII